MTVYQLKISLKGLIPPIWRRVQVSSTITVAELHLILQAVMGWQNLHTYRFIIEGVAYGQPETDDWPAVQSAEQTRLEQIISEQGQKFIYVYDFESDWQHVLKVEQILQLEAEDFYPRCLTGQRACPPEDCGGIFSYSDLLHILADPTHEDYSAAIDWLGREFNPEAFDPEATNIALNIAS